MKIAISILKNNKISDFKLENNKCDLYLVLSQEMSRLLELIKKIPPLESLNITVYLKNERSDESIYDFRSGFSCIRLDDGAGFLFINKNGSKNINSDNGFDRLSELEIFLKNIIFTNCDLKLINIRKLFPTLHNIFAVYASHLGDIELLERSIFHNENFYKSEVRFIDSTKPQISVVIPTYKSEAYILDAIWSILNQTFKDFEIILVHEPENNDHTIALVRLFSDRRIRIIQNKEKLGLAESLNIGICAAEGKYIARMDADDICKIDRFQLQWDYLEKHTDVDILGGAIEVISKGKKTMLSFPQFHSAICAHLLFHLVIAHSTVMFRKDTFLKYNLRYSPKAYGEDYELWTRAMEHMRFHNLKNILVEYRLHSSNITNQKKYCLACETGRIMANILKRDFGIVVPKEYMKYWNSWINYYSVCDESTYKKMIKIEKTLLLYIWNTNSRLHKYDSKSLKSAIMYRWNWINGKIAEERII